MPYKSACLSSGMEKADDDKRMQYAYDIQMFYERWKTEADLKGSFVHLFLWLCVHVA